MVTDAKDGSPLAGVTIKVKGEKQSPNRSKRTFTLTLNVNIKNSRIFLCGLPGY